MSHWKPGVPIILIFITYVCEHILQIFFESLCYAIFLWMIRGTLLVMDLKFLCQSFNCFVNKVRTSIANQNIRASKSGQNVFKYEVHSMGMSR